MDGGDGSPVMTDSKRWAYRYRYGHRASPRLPGMRKSWSNDSLAGYDGGYGGGGSRASCVCAPTTHPGSFRCKHHRHASNIGAAAQVAGAPAAATDADAKHHEREAQETAPAADQADADKSS